MTAVRGKETERAVGRENRRRSVSVVESIAPDFADKKIEESDKHLLPSDCFDICGGPESEV